MTRREKTLRKVSKLITRGERCAFRATSHRDPFGVPAIRAGQRASEAFTKARILLEALAQREQARGRERQIKKRKKLPVNWWR